MAFSLTNPEYFLECKLRRLPGSVEKVSPERLRRKRLLVWRRSSHCKSDEVIVAMRWSVIGEGMMWRGMDANELFDSLWSRTGDKFFSINWTDQSNKFVNSFILCPPFKLENDALQSS